MAKSISTVVKRMLVIPFFFFYLELETNTCKINDRWLPCFAFFKKVTWAFFNLKSLKFCDLETGKSFTTLLGIDRPNS